jgi:peptide/nickel transport system permease protein
VDNLRERMHLNEPLVVQYGFWLGDALRGNFGKSLVTRRDVASDIVLFFPATFELALVTGLIMGGGGIALGIVSARYRDTWIDSLIRVLTYMGTVTPPFVVGIILVLIFGYLLNWLPVIGRLSQGTSPPPVVSGLMTIDTLLAGDLGAFVDTLRHLIMPAISLAVTGLGQEARITRATMSDNMAKDYIAAERALGIPERLIMWRFLLKPSLIPTVSILGLDFAATIGNAFLVELVFNWPGISRYGVNAMLNKDLNAITAVVLTLGLVFSAVNFAVDLVVGVLDPRIRLSMQRNE